MNNQKDGLKYSLILLFLFTLLIAVPFIVKPFNDRYLNLMNEQYPKLETIDNPLKQELQEQIKIPYYLTLDTDKKTYFPYEPIKISFFVVDKKTQELATNIIPSVKVLNSNGISMKTVFQSTSQSLNFNTQNNLFQTTILLDDTSYVGDISLEVVIPQKSYNQEIIRKLEIDIKKPQPLFSFPKKYAFLGLESKDVISSRSILSTEGKEIGVNGLVPWFKLLNNNAVVMPSAVSKTFSLSNNDVWDTQKLQESKALSKQFSQQGFDVALWVQALKLDGLDTEKYQYQYSIPQGSNTNEMLIVSLQDDTRKTELISVLKDHIDDSNVKYVGLKDVFFQEYHAEAYETFVKQYSLNASQEVKNKAFEKWKEYAMVDYVKDLFSSLKKTKPVFMIFSAEEISFNPNFVQMAFAAGVDFIFVDLDVSMKDFDVQLQLISQSLLEEYSSQVVFSYCLNYNNLVSGQSSPINNWIEQNLRLFQKKNADTIYIKDFYRAMFGNRGPYPAYEWMLSIGELIGSWKQSKGVYPIEQSYTVNTTTINSNIVLTIALKNISSAVISNITVDLLPVTENNRLNILKLSELRSREMFRTNILLTNIQFKQSILQKRTRFLALESSLSIAKKSNQQVHLIPFIDPSVDRDIISSGEEFNLQNRAIAEEKLRQEEKRLEQEEEKRLTELSNKAAQDALAKQEALRKEQEAKEKEVEEKQEVKKKESWFERRARERREKKEREEREAREAKEKKK